MFLTLQNALMGFPPAYGVVGGGAVVGIVVWLAAARRRVEAIPNRWQRLTLFLLLTALLLAWWQASVLAPQWKNKSAPIKGKLIFTERMSKRLNVARPTRASFEDPEIRRVDNREVILMLPPGEMEWELDGKMHAVAIAFGFDPPSYERGTTNGAILIADLIEGDNRREIYRRFLDPIRRPADRAMQRDVIVLPPYKPGTHLVLRTDPGEYGDTAWDWVYLAEVRFKPKFEAP